MSRYAANSAALPQSAPNSLWTAIAGSETHEFGCDMPYLSVAPATERRVAIGSNFQAGDSEEAFGPPGFQPFRIPPVSRSLLRGLSCALRQLALLLRLRRPSSYGFRSGASVNAELRHLGAGPTSLIL